MLKNEELNTGNMELSLLIEKIGGNCLNTEEYLASEDTLDQVKNFELEIDCFRDSSDFKLAIDQDYYPIIGRVPSANLDVYLD